MRFVKRVIKRPKFVRKGEVDGKPVVAQLPPRLIPGSIASPSLMALIIVSKFADHLPLYRLEKILEHRYQVPIRRQHMCDWIGYVVDNWLQLIYYSIRQGRDYLQIDETPICYLDHDRKVKRVTSGCLAIPKATCASIGNWDVPEQLRKASLRILPVSCCNLMATRSTTVWPGKKELSRSAVALMPEENFSKPMRNNNWKQSATCCSSAVSTKSVSG